MCMYVDTDAFNICIYIIHIYEQEIKKCVCCGTGIFPYSN